MFGGDARRSLARPAVDLGLPKRKPLWARGLKAYMEYPPSYCDGVLYVNTFKGDTWALDSETGKVIWRKVSNSPKPSTPAIAGDNVIVSSKDGTVTALTRSSGKLVWQLRTNAIVESSPAIAEGVAYFGSTDGRLFAVDADSGRVRWAFDTGGRINSSPSLAEGRVCVTTYAGSIFCVRQRDGAKLWSTYVKRDAFRYESFYASASTDGERLYTIARSGKIVTLDASSGRILWTDAVNSLGYSTPAVGSDRIFVGDFNGGLRAYGKRNGRLLWRSVVGGRILGAPVIVGDLVFFSTLETETYAARVSDGRSRVALRPRQVLARHRHGAHVLLLAQRVARRLPRSRRACVAPVQRGQLDGQRCQAPLSVKGKRSTFVPVFPQARPLLRRAKRRSLWTTDSGSNRGAGRCLSKGVRHRVAGLGGDVARAASAA